ncbi:MAG: acyltransferase [Alphaproteobacteria bacterium]|nr:acyltransferase [Alphaproteobacteria bacterium]
MTTAPQPLRLDNIQALRGAAVLAVVLSHLMTIERKYAGDRLLGDFLSIGFSGVDLFFAISGFVMVYVAWNKPGGLRSAASFLFARGARIYPLYWLVSLAVLSVWMLRPELVFASNANVSIMRSFALWPAQSLPLLAVGWTLIHEMYFYLIFTVLVFSPPRFRLWGLMAWGALVLAAFLAGAGAHGPVLRVLSHPLSFEFLGGALAALALRRFAGQYWRWSLLAGFALFVAACLVSLRTGLAFWESWPRAASFTPAVSLIVYGAAGAERAGKIFSRVLVWVGDQSYALYLTHVLSLSVAGRIWAMFAQDGPLDNIVMLSLLLAIALLAGEATHRLIETPLLHSTKHLRRRLF